MTPDYENAALKAIQTVCAYNLDPYNTDPLFILKKLGNVRLISYGISEINEAGFYCNEEMFSKNDNEAFSLVNNNNGQLQYIVIYDQSKSPVKLHFALARELGHVILSHDGTTPEEIWLEEANCFAYHFLCPLPLLHKIKEESKQVNFRPIRKSLSWEFKDMRVFDSIDHLKLFVVTERNKLNRYVGNPRQYEPEDVKLINQIDYEERTGWKNRFDIVLDKEIVGHCGI